MLHKILTAVTALAVVASLLAGAAGQAAAVTGYDSAYFGESAFLTLGPSQTGQFAVGFNNTGSTGWLTGSTSQVDLTVCLSDKTTCNTTSPNAAFATNWLSSTAYSTTSTTYVGPGQTGYFVYNVTVPTTATPGLYRFHGDLSLHGTASMIHPEGYYQDVQVPAVGAPAKLGCAASPTSLTAGSTTQSSTVTVTVQDALGNTITTSTSSMTASQSGGTGSSLNGGAANAAATVSAVGGVGTFTLTPGTIAGTDQISVASGNLTGCLVNVTIAAPGAPAALKITAPSQSQFPASGPTATTATAAFIDAGGTATVSTASTTVTFTVDNATICFLNNVAGTTSVQIVAGSGSPGASLPFTMTGVPGSCTLTASATGLTTGTKTFTAIAAGPASKWAITANTCSATPTTSSGGTTCTITAQIQDAAGNPTFTGAVAGTLAFSACSPSTVATNLVGAPTATALPTSNSPQTTTTTSGSATFTVSDAYAQSCTATVSGTYTAATGTVSFTGFGTAAQLTLRPILSNIPANGVATTSLTVCVRDAAGNVVTSAVDSVSLLHDTGTSTTIASANPATTASGCASYTIQSASSTAGTDTYHAVDTTKNLTSNTSSVTQP